MAVPQDSIIRLTLMLMLFDNLTIIYTWLNIKIDRFQDIKSAADIGNEFQFVLNWVETCPIKFNGSKLKKKIYSIIIADSNINESISLRLFVLKCYIRNWKNYIKSINKSVAGNGGS